MAKRGKSVNEIAKALGKGKTTVRCAIDRDAYQRQLKLSRERKARERKQFHAEGAPSKGHEIKHKPEPFIQRIERVPSPITLPTLRILLTQPETEVRRFRIVTPARSRTESPGARRWREHHESMIRRGLIPTKPSVLEEMHP
ncbi:hypothetical protein [Bosea sp. AS-1]|uniref:hypothetical protein n=1 Tax=Bosea sp. AS-1 TaxID=2015316 RepID=UPI000B7796B9|nr:hypothetical protein [Bosea sp. AS-1]